MKTFTIIKSRVFGTKINKESNDFIVPYADMFNYKYKSDMTHWSFSTETNSFHIKAKENIELGSEIYVYYGNKSNSNFLLFYGFIIEDNENDDIYLTFSINPKDPLGESKMIMLNKKSSEEVFRLTMKIETKQFQQMMSYLRFITFEEVQDSTLNVLLFGYYIVGIIREE